MPHDLRQTKKQTKKPIVGRSPGSFYNGHVEIQTDIERQGADMKEDCGEFILTLFHAATNTHILHLRSKSYAEHVALGAFYQELPDLVDAVAEAIQGLTETLIDYPIDYYPPAETALEELRSLKEYVFEERSELPQDSEIQNLIDSISELINSTIYKLKFLK